MKLDEFHKFYDEIIESYINEILEADKDIGCLTLKKRNIEKIYIYYKKTNRSKKKL